MSATKRPIAREFLAGIAGFAFFVLTSAFLFKASGYDPHAAVAMSFRILSIVAGIVFAFIAGYLAATISPASPMRPAIMVALLIAVSATLSMLVSRSAELWSQLAALCFMAPAVIGGARLRRRRIQNFVQPPDGAN